MSSIAFRYLRICLMACQYFFLGFLTYLLTILGFWEKFGLIHIITNIKLPTTLALGIWDMYSSSSLILTILSFETCTYIIKCVLTTLACSIPKRLNALWMYFGLLLGLINLDLHPQNHLHCAHFLHLKFLT